MENANIAPAGHYSYAASWSRSRAPVLLFSSFYFRIFLALAPIIIANIWAFMNL